MFGIRNPSSTDKESRIHCTEMIRIQGWPPTQTFFGLRHALLPRSLGRNALLPRSWGRNAWRSPGTSGWEVIPRAIRLFSTFAARFSNFVTLKKFTCGKSIRKMKVKPKDFSGCQLPLTRESRRTKECVTRNQTPEYQSCLGQSH